MATGNCVVQGDTAVAAVEAKTQIIVEAQALGTQNLVEALHDLRQSFKRGPRDPTADAPDGDD